MIKVKKIRFNAINFDQILFRLVIRKYIAFNRFNRIVKEWFLNNISLIMICFRILFLNQNQIKLYWHLFQLMLVYIESHIKYNIKIE